MRTYVIVQLHLTFYLAITVICFRFSAHETLVTCLRLYDQNFCNDNYVA